MTASISGWIDITSTIAADRRTANISVAWRRPSKGRPKLEFLLNNRLVSALGWQDGIHASILASPDRTEIAFVPCPDGKLLRDRSGGLQLSHGVDWIAADLPARPAEITPHRIEGAALIVALPAWAQPARRHGGAQASKLTEEREELFRRLWADPTKSPRDVLQAMNALPGEPYTATQSMYSLAAKLGLPTERTAIEPPPKATAPAAPATFPPAHFRPPVVVKDPPPEVLDEDEREAEALIRANPDRWHGRAIAEEYGWDIPRAAAFVQRVRAAMAAETKGAAE